MKLLLEGRAYPCFATAEQLDGIRAQQEAAGEDPGYYGRWAVWRDADYAQVEAQVKAGAPFVIRFRSEGDPARKFKFTDLVKGALELPENHMDHVLLKSDGIPTYHFAHAVDDTLMGTTHVVRGEEWLPSLPFHLELFRALGFKAPKYLHIAQLLTREADGSKRKLSKRDGSASVSMYREKGYAPACITEYVMTLLNSNYEEWRAANPEKPFTDFPFSIKKMSASGARFDPDKPHDGGGGIRRPCRLGPRVRRGPVRLPRGRPRLCGADSEHRPRREKAAQGHRDLERGEGVHGLFLRRALHARLHRITGL